MSQDHIRNFCIIAHIGADAYEETQVSSSGLGKRGFHPPVGGTALLLPKYSESYT